MKVVFMQAALQAAAVVHQTQPHEAGLNAESSDGNEFIYHKGNLLQGAFDGGNQWTAGVCAADNKAETQSPIDLPADTSGLKSTSISGSWGNLTDCQVKNTGHSYNIQNCAGMAGMKFDWGGETYTLAQAHIHARSEHTIGGTHSFLEMHMVHMNGDKTKAAVVGTMFDVSESAPDNAILNIFLNDAVKTIHPSKAASVSGVMNLDYLNNKKAYNYNGGLTTPPCSAIVSWFVVSEIQQISVSQAANLFSKTGAELNTYGGLLGTQNAGDNFRNLVSTDSAKMHGRVANFVSISVSN